MSIRHGLLALLAHGPRYGYQLRSEFEQHTGGTWPLNVGQVYSTLTRLERDGLVAPAGHDDAGHAFYALTGTGHAAVEDWFGAPVHRESRPRDELAIKLALAVTTPGVDVGAVLQAQRHDTMRALRDFTRLKAKAREDDLAWSLVLDGLVFQAEAEIRWLDHCEERLRAAGTDAVREATTGTPASGTPADAGDEDAAPRPAATTEEGYA